MCLPMAALGIIGGVAQGIGAAQQASASAASHRANQRLQERQATIEAETGAYRADRQQDEVDRALGAQRASVAGSGLALSGSSAGVIEESATEGAMDVQAIRWNSQLASDNSLYQSEISGMNAASAERSAPMAFMTPVIGSVARFGNAFGERG